MSAVPTSAPLSLRARVARLVDDPRFGNAIIALIVLNAITLGMQTSDALVARWGQALHAIDRFALAVFVIELLLRFFAHRLAVLKDPWGLFDTIIVGIALVPASGPFSVLRSLRVLRALRLVALVPSMRRVVGALLGALPGMGSIVMLLVLVMYVAAVMATKLFGDTAPEMFGNLGSSFFTLFQVMTVEGWPDIARGIMATQPYAWIFFVIYLLICTFCVLNLFIAVIVNAMQSQFADEVKEGEAEQTQVLLTELRELRAEVAAMRAERA